MIKRQLQFIAAAWLCLGGGLLGCGAGAVGSVEGQVSVDGAPAELGTISFKPADNPTGRGAGGAVSAGRFTLGGDHGLKPGKHLVSVQLSKPTGKTFNDPQRGQVPVLQPLELSDSPQEVELTAENAGALALEFHARQKL